MPLGTTLIVVAIVGAASFIRSAVGFGMGLVAMPLLGLVLELRTATPMLAISGMAMSIMIIGQDWRHVEWKSLRYLFAGGVFGIPIGILLLRGLPPEPIKMLLGVTVILFAVHGLFGRDRLPLRSTPLTAGVLGFASGALSSGFNVGGPPLVAYFTLQTWDPPVFRATLQGYFFIAGAVSLVGHGVAGLWTVDVALLAGATLPAMVLGTLLGRWTNRRIEPAQFHRIIYGALLVLGTFLFI